MTSPQPTIRKPIGVLFMLGLIAGICAVAVALSDVVGQWHVLLQGLFYLALGMIWIAPLRPLMIWMETGKFRAPSNDDGR